jgi:glycosyltransferase involved in cell wall biosynthesis
MGFMDDADGSSDRHLMLFELSVGGHYPGYIQHFVRYWSEQGLPGRLSVVVSPQFIERHAEVVAVAQGSRRQVDFIPITAAEASALLPRQSPVHRAVRAFQSWQILCRYAAVLESTHCLIMYLDAFQSPLAWGAKAPCSVSGIYFRPSFHYSSLTGYQPSWKDRIQHWRERFILPRVLRHPQLQTVFCLDPFAIRPLKQFHGHAAAVPLPDPVQIYNHSEDQVVQLQKDLGIQPGRLVFLMFGALDGRKGIYQLLDAILKVSPILCQKLCLLFVGPIEPRDRKLMQPRLAQIAESLPVQIILRNAFIPDREIQVYFQLADVILAVYQRHVGMSAILARAATAQTPVLASDYGLMGEVARRYKLGLTLDSTSPDEIAKGVTRLLEESPAAVGDRARMRAFAEQNSAERFASILFQYAR